MSEETRKAIVRACLQDLESTVSEIQKELKGVVLVLDLLRKKVK